MNIESLKYFCELARVGSFNGAAKNVFISQQGLNKAVTALEDEVGFKLVERNRRGVTLTEAGEIFLQRAGAMLAEYEGLGDDLLAYALRADTSSEPFEITTSSYALAVLSGTPSSRDVLVNTMLREAHYKQIVDAASNGTGDELFLVELYAAKLRELNERGFAFEPILETRVGVIWREGFPLAGRESLHREELAHFPIAYNSQRDMRKCVELLFSNYPLQNVQLVTSSVRLLIEFTHKEWVSLFDSFGFHVAKHDPGMPTDDLNFTPLATPLARAQVGFLYRKDARPNARTRRRMDVIKHILTKGNADYITLHRRLTAQ